ncbi:MAG TPA: hypothetical protein VKS79_02035 [Gemmataceae bacterium]|nr:hypothetical protein [Gemmataceae bacterium]
MLLAKRPVRPYRHFQPAIEVLEGRALMSAGITIVGHEMDITGGMPGSTISVTDNGSGTMSAWMKTGTLMTSQVAQNINKVVIHGGDGNDIIYFQNSGVLKHALELDIDTGAGSDHEYLNFQRGLNGAHLGLDLVAGAGADSVDLSFGNIQNSKVNVNANLHSSKDVFSSVLFYGLSGNSALNYNIQGNGMADHVVLNFMGKVDSAASINVVDQNTPNANDRLSIRYRGELDGQLNLNVQQAAVWYGVQSQFTLYPSSMGTLNVRLSDAWNEYDSSLVVTDHTGGAKISIIDPLEEVLTGPTGTMVTAKAPKPLV